VQENHNEDSTDINLEQSDDFEETKT